MISLFLVMALMTAMQPDPVVRDRAIDVGVSQALAAERASAIRDVHYDLTFTIPAAKD